MWHTDIHAGRIPTLIKIINVQTVFPLRYVGTLFLVSEVSDFFVGLSNSFWIENVLIFFLVLFRTLRLDSVICRLYLH